MKFYYAPNLKYTNRQIVYDSTLQGLSFVEKEYENIDSPDTINGHIIYQLEVGESVPTYIVEDNGRRWYVSGITQLRTGKFQISLLRDIISEGTQDWKNEQAYISAGYATDYNKYKVWGLPFTNTKISEQPLTINGQPSYFVFYTNTQTISDTGAITESDLKLSSTQVPSGTQVDVELDNLSDYEYFSYLSNSPENIDNLLYLNWSDTIQVLFSGNVANEGTKCAWIGNVGDTITNVSGYQNFNAETYENRYNKCSINMTYINPIQGNSFFTFLNQSDVVTLLENLKDNFQQRIATQEGVKKIISKNDYYSINGDVNKIFLDKATSKIYRLRSRELKEITNEIFASDVLIQNFVSALNNVNKMAGFFQTPPRIVQPNEEDTVITQGASGGRTLYYYFEELEQVTNFAFNFIAETPKLPKSAVRCVNISSAGSGIEDAELGQALMQMSANTANLNNDTGQIIDIQYLPFSIATQKNDNIIVNQASMTAEFLNLDDYYFTIQNSPLTDINKETDTIKLVSPSRASQFVFSPYNNDGNLNFEFKATIRPFSTIMYLRPHTTGLLLADFDDKNCLIIEEDFSLTLLSSEWSQYVRQNRNYMNTFNREIQGREFERTWERRVEQAQAKSDEWTARNIMAQKAQVYTGNIPIVSGIAGAIGTTWKDSAYMEAAQVDREYNEAMYQESLSLSRDMFSYQLDNIKAQPTIPNKITTIDCKFMGYILMEFWSTNETEKAAINNYYNYNGNRIDAYGTFNDYWGSFIRGKIIISQNYTQPEINELNRRLQMGVFTGAIT